MPPHGTPTTPTSIVLGSVFLQHNACSCYFCPSSRLARGVRPGLELFLPHRLDIDTSGLVIVGGWIVLLFVFVFVFYFGCAARVIFYFLTAQVFLSLFFYFEVVSNTSFVSWFVSLYPVGVVVKVSWCMIRVRVLCAFPFSFPFFTFFFLVLHLVLVSSNHLWSHGGNYGTYNVSRQVILSRLQQHQHH